MLGFTSSSRKTLTSGNTRLHAVGIQFRELIHIPDHSGKIRRGLRALVVVQLQVRQLGDI